MRGGPFGVGGAMRVLAWHLYSGLYFENLMPTKAYQQNDKIPRNPNHFVLYYKLDKWAYVEYRKEHSL